MNWVLILIRDLWSPKDWLFSVNQSIRSQPERQLWGDRPKKKSAVRILMSNLKPNERCMFGSEVEESLTVPSHSCFLRSPSALQKCYFKEGGSIWHVGPAQSNVNSETKGIWNIPGPSEVDAHIGLFRVTFPEQNPSLTFLKAPWEVPRFLSRAARALV